MPVGKLDKERTGVIGMEVVKTIVPVLKIELVILHQKGLLQLPRSTVMLGIMLQFLEGLAGAGTAED